MSTATTLLHNSRVEDRRRRLAPSNAAGSTTEAEAETSATDGENGGVPDNFKFTSLDGRWSVRPLNKENMLEVGTVVQLQTEGFHTPNMIPFLDSMFKNNFKAEVLSEMQKKLKYNPVERYVSLVVESTSMPGQVVGRCLSQEFCFLYSLFWRCQTSSCALLP